MAPQIPVSNLTQGGLDNLLKGAATQCLQVRFQYQYSGCYSFNLDSEQNLNLALGYDEYAGIPMN